jgi:sulfur carrier protein
MQKEAVQQNTAITLTVNGEKHTVHATTPRALLTELELEGNFFAIAINRRVIRRTEWDESSLQDGDSIEIVTPRQGG